MSAELLITHWSLEAPIAIGLALCAGLYLWGAARCRWPVRRTIAFMGGLANILVALQSGIAGYDDRLLSVHMVQHMVLLMLAPLLLLAGQPVLLAIRALPNRGVRRRIISALHAAGSLTRPFACVAAFSSVLLLTHLSAFFEASLRHPLLHYSEHVLYLVAGLLLWWPILDGDPAPSRRLSGLGRLVYVLAAMPAMALIGAYLNRHPELAYPSYGPPSRALGVPALTDQARAGAIMWVSGTVFMTAVGLWASLSALLAEERGQQARDRRMLSTKGLT